MYICRFERWSEASFSRRNHEFNLLFVIGVLSEKGRPELLCATFSRNHPADLSDLFVLCVHVGVLRWLSFLRAAILTKQKKKRKTNDKFHARGTRFCYLTNRFVVVLVPWRVKVNCSCLIYIFDLAFVFFLPPLYTIPPQNFLHFFLSQSRSEKRMII